MRERAQYRAYVVGPDGRSKSYAAIIVPDDTTAVEVARKLIDGEEVELWHRDRKVAALAPTK
jgi:hypothetical protein